MYTVGLDKLKSFLILFSQNRHKPFGAPQENKSKKEVYVSKAINNTDILLENTNHIKEILFGSLLGDGRLEMPPRGINAWFGLVLSETQKKVFYFYKKFVIFYMLI